MNLSQPDAGVQHSGVDFDSLRQVAQCGGWVKIGGQGAAVPIVRPWCLWDRAWGFDRVMLETIGLRSFVRPSALDQEPRWVWVRGESIWAAERYFVKLLMLPGKAAGWVPDVHAN